LFGFKDSNTDHGTSTAPCLTCSRYRLHHLSHFSWRQRMQDTPDSMHSPSSSFPTNVLHQRQFPQQRLSCEPSRAGDGVPAIDPFCSVLMSSPVSLRAAPGGRCSAHTRTCSTGSIAGCTSDAVCRVRAEEVRATTGIVSSISCLFSFRLTGRTSAFTVRRTAARDAVVIRLDSSRLPAY
jgi:hypothetical protein